MNDSRIAASGGTPAAAVRGLVANRELLADLVKRDFLGRYRGSALGLAWSLLHPLFMLAVYTVVFSVAFKARWGMANESKVAFGIVLFSGMIVHGFFAECLNRAPDLVTSRPNFVKKVVFPLEILPWMALCSALLHALISLALLIVFCVAAGIPLQPGTVLVPVVLLPLFLQTLGLSWILASLGVYLRDLSHGIGMLTTVALFFSPVFYPVDALPPVYRAFMAWNPITLPVVQLRDVMLWGNAPDWTAWSVNLAAGCALGALGYWWFQKTRRGFADVL